MASARCRQIANKLAEEDSRKLEFLLYGLARLLRRRFDSKATRITPEQRSSKSS